MSSRNVSDGAHSASIPAMSEMVRLSPTIREIRMCLRASVRAQSSRIEMTKSFRADRPSLPIEQASSMSINRLGTSSMRSSEVCNSGLRARDIEGADIQNPHAWAERRLADTLARCKRAVVQEYAKRAEELR